MPGYALIIIETPASRAAILRDRTAHREALTKWMSERAAEGALLGGEAFETEKIAPVTVRRIDQEVIVDPAPHHTGPESLGGFVLIRADDLEGATEIAKTWPPSGETIEIRPLWVAPPQA